MQSMRHKSLTNQQYILIMALKRGPGDELARIEDKHDVERYIRRVTENAKRDGCYDPEDPPTIRIGDWVVDENYEWDEFEYAGATMGEAIEERASLHGFRADCKDTWEVARLALDSKGRVRAFEDGEVGGVVTRSMR